MNAAVTILGVSGGLDAASASSTLLECAATAAQRVGRPSGPVELETLDSATLRGLPHFEPGGGEGSAVRALRGAVDGCDALLLSTPEENCSSPGALKDAIDWLGSGAVGSEPELAGLPAAVIGASGDDFGADWAQADLRKVLDAAGARVLASELSVPHFETAFDAERGQAELRDPALARRLEHLLAELAAQVRARNAV